MLHCDFFLKMVENTGQSSGRQLHTGKTSELGGDNSSDGVLDVGVGQDDVARLCWTGLDWTGLVGGRVALGGVGVVVD